MQSLDDGSSEEADEGEEVLLGLQDPTVADVCAVVIEPKPDWRVVLHVRVRAQTSQDFKQDFIMLIKLVRKYGIAVSSEAEKLYEEFTRPVETH